MSDTREPGISPLTRPPHSQPPLPNGDPSHEAARESLRMLSPLRVEQNVNDPATTSTNGRSPANGHPPRVSSRSYEPQEFPFDGSPVPVPTPTNEQYKSGEHSTKVPPKPAGTNGSATAPSQIAPVSRRQTGEGDESDVPNRRRSVQFARSTTVDGGPAHSRNQSWEEDAGEPKGKERERQGSSIMTKLKALAAPIALPGHSRSHSAFAGHAPAIQENSPRAPLSPASERGDFRFDGQESEADADAESAGEGPSRPPRRRRKSRRWFDDGTQTAPTTPKNAPNGAFFSKDSPNLTPISTTNRPSFLRRGTMSDIPENQRQGVSEDEGRDRLAKERAWVRGLHSARGISYGALRRHEPDESEERRPSHLRRLTGFAGAVDGQPSPWRLRSDRTSSLSAQKWRSIKSTLKMLGATRRAERQVDHAKSAELMAELLAGAPAALFLASMFQRDERGHRRIPVLLEQLKVSITDSYAPSGEKDKVGDRHTVFRIELEYGSGLTRMKWIIHRSIRDFARLHVNYKLAQQQERLNFNSSSKKKRETRSGKRKATEDDLADDTHVKGPKLPPFPVSAMPYLRGLRALGLDEEEERKEQEQDMAAAAAQNSGHEGEASGTDRPSRTRRGISAFSIARRKSSIGSPDPSSGGPGAFGRQGSFSGAAGHSSNNKLAAVERQRKKLERYLNQLVAFLIFRPDSNRLCKFLELSALGVRLAAEGGYHGKEGYMMIRSSKGVDNRKKWGAAPLVQRHWPKWFLVRHSYIVCVDSPEEMNVYDVFLVDCEFALDSKKSKMREKRPREIASEAKSAATGHHQLRLSNTERKLKLLAKNERQLQQFEESIRFMVANTPWAKPQRFGSFAPVRKKVYAQWLVDGRDYMWNVSRAINMARDVIYIHDWWLSPELYMRRPAAISQKWRLDRLLQRKAQEGVKIFVIVYRNINTAIPIDSEYTKFSLLDLHPNIFVQRSPNQIRQNTFFWAHHEKICIVDHTIAFCGGVDLCFGRWDTPQHSCVDDKPTGFELDDMPKDADHCQLWPGKDYSNPRVLDFYNLDKPYEEMYDRTKIPRMPWHDIGMQIVGQPARDLTRHFVQRWNYLLRQRKPSRPTPQLLPPPDFNPADIEALGLDGTCEVQILRSASSWSLGTPNRTEHSIMNAYVQMISTSQHFVYIENQFYISSCEVLGTRIENRISDALVDRIKRAHQNQEDWRACLIIPLMPGFQNSVDQQDGSSVRLIMTCQYRSICRGEQSIFGRLRAAGIEPEDYIQFYALRSWGAVGPNKALVTEQLYIHAKCMIVDDRVAIIGSANINERSMLGSRDSEVAAVVRDTEMLDSYMAGEPFKVGKFPHTLRMRLMREHLGVDVDNIVEDQQSDVDSFEFHTESSSPSMTEATRLAEQKLTENKHRVQDELIARAERLHSFNHDSDELQVHNPHIAANKKVTRDNRIIGNPTHQKDVRGEGPDHMQEIDHNRPDLARGRDSYISDAGHEVLVSDVASETHVPSPKRSTPQKGRKRSNTTGTRASTSGHSGVLPRGNSELPPPRLSRMDTRQLGLVQLSQLPALPSLDDTDIGGPPLQRTFSGGSANRLHPLISSMRRPVVTEDCMRDPLSDAFYLDTWHTVAENNTKLFRHVFRCQPDNEVRTWKEYKEYAAFAERFAQSQGEEKSSQRRQQEAPGKTGPPGMGGTVQEKLTEKMSMEGNGVNSPLGNVEDWAKDQEKQEQEKGVNRPSSTGTTPSSVTMNEKADLVQPQADGDIAASPVNTRTPTDVFTFPPPPIPDSDPLTVAPTNTTNESKDASSLSRNRTVTISEPQNHPSIARAHANTISTTAGSRKGRRRGTTKSSTRQFHASDADTLLSKEDARQLLDLVQGHLVVWPYEWLEKEEAGGGWLYTVDQIAPLEIYT